MITVVRELTDAAPMRAKVVIGAPLERVARSHSIIDSLFDGGELVAYRVRLQARERLFVFRTLKQAANGGATKVPGVQPQVLLLLCAHTGRRIHRALRILTSVRERGCELGTLSDAFFLRASTTLASRAPIESIVTTLLRQEPLWTC
jgi:hypothetical protein